MAQSKDFSITDLSGGYNDTDPPTTLAPHQCTVAQNVDFFRSPCGTRRLGCTAITTSSSLTAKTAITALYRHLPTNDDTEAQLWAYAASTGSDALAYKDTAWHDVAFVDAASATNLYPYQVAFQTLHGKLYIAYKSAVDRLHVWDGTTLRRTGLAEPSLAPTGANSGVGTFSSTRYYRVRETVQAAGITTLRSEPSSVLTFAPSGAGSGITVTKPATENTNSTHWELEASLDNTLFYIIATTVIATTTSIDTSAASVGYSAFTLSEDIGDYETIPSGRFLLVDQDRLLIFGSFENATNASVVRWTPVLNDPGVGNDERIPLDTDNLLNLDGYEGGGITGAVGPINGVIYVFKFGHIYRLIRTGQRESAYEPVALTKSRGALDGSVVEAVDQTGRPAVYFLDPKVGPCRLGSSGMMDASADILNTWATVNVTGAAVVSRSLFDPNTKKIHWWIATGSALQPSVRITLQIEATRESPDGIRFGWTYHTGASAQAVSAVMFASNIESNIARGLMLKPLIAVGNAILQMENGTTDNGVAFVPAITSRPFLLTNSVNSKFGIRAGALVGDADATAVVGVQLVRDFGRETTTAVNASLAPTGSEDPVIVPMDSLRISDCKAVQLKLSDGTGNTGSWAVQRIDMIPRNEEVG